MREDKVFSNLRWQGEEKNEFKSSKRGLKIKEKEPGKFQWEGTLLGGENGQSRVLRS